MLIIAIPHLTCWPFGLPNLTLPLFTNQNIARGIKSVFYSLQLCWLLNHLCKISPLGRWLAPRRGDQSFDCDHTVNPINCAVAVTDK